MKAAENASSADDPISRAKKRLFPPLRNRILSQAADALASGQADTVETLVENYLQKHADDPDALNLKADIARRRERFREAAQLLRTCVQHGPNHAGYRFNLAVLLRRLNCWEEAESHLDWLLVLDPENALFRDQKAKLLHASGRHEEAIAYQEGLAADYPASADIWLRLADGLRSAKRYAESVAAYRRSIELQPVANEAYPRLPGLRTYAFTTDDVVWMEEQLSAPNLTPDDRANLHFALAKAYEDQKLHAKAFENYSRANAQRRLSVRFDPDRLTEHGRACRKLFTREFFRARSGWGAPSDLPIFIVGMPRSGSTLLEQIISSHSGVEGLGELPDLGIVVSELLKFAGTPDSAAGLAESIGRMDATSARRLGEKYLSLASARRITTRPFFTDKGLSNSYYTGLIELILPHAKIVDARRHPLDCSWSCFKSHFPKGQAFSHRLGDIGRQYRDYVHLMAHFDRVLPNRIHRLVYEHLIADPEGEVRRLLDYLGLPFEPQCLRFHENRRTVITLSAEQVRTPLYRTGIGQWKPYEQWLGPLKAALGPVLDSYPNAPE